MSDESGREIYEELGVRPVINATGGNRTLLGGSILSTKVMFPPVALITGLTPNSS